MELPQDIKPNWFPIIRRLQSISKSQGLSILSIRILVDAEGNPVAWASPTQTKIEPKSEVSALFELVTK